MQYGRKFWIIFNYAVCCTIKLAITMKISKIGKIGNAAVDEQSVTTSHNDALLFLLSNIVAIRVNSGHLWFPFNI